MEVFIRDEEINRIHIITDKFQNGNAIKIGSAIDDYIGCKNAEYSALFKSLEQHDAEVKKQVVEELREWYYKKLLEVRQKYKIQSEDKGSEEEMARLYALFLGRYNILGDLDKKLADLENATRQRRER